MKKHLKLTLLLAALVLGLRSFSQSEFSNFSKDTYWVNSEFQLNPITFKDKLLVTLIWDMANPVDFYHMKQLEVISKKYPQIQLVSLVKGDLEHPFALSELTAYVQANAINHPFGATADFYPFIQDGEAFTSKLFIYEKSLEPTLFTPESGTIASLISLLQEKLQRKEYLAQFTAWQMKNAVDPKHYADPLLEHPSAVTVNPSNGEIYVAENSQHRIARYSNEGKLLDFVGGPDAGDKDGNLRGGRLQYVSGLSYDPISEQLFFVDQVAAKIKVADFKSELVYTFLGNGSNSKDFISELNGVNSPLGYPVDVEVRGSSLFVLMASPAQLIEVDIASGKLKSNAIVEGKLKGAGVPTKLSKGHDGFLFCTSGGAVFKLKYEGDKLNPEVVFSSANWNEKVTAAEERKGELFLLMGRQNSIFLSKKGKLELLAGTNEKGYANAKEGKLVSFNQPVNMELNGGNLMVCDFGNHALREVSTAKGATYSIVPQYAFDYMISGDALNVGEPIFFESEIFGEGANTVKISWDITGWEFLPEGRNELNAEEPSGITWEMEKFNDKGCELVIPTDLSPEFAQVELYWTLRNLANPDLVIIKKAVFNLSYTVIPGEGTTHELSFQPHLLP